jgi:hypothetical protein
MRAHNKKLTGAITVLAAIATIILAGQPTYDFCHRFFAVADSPAKIEELRQTTSQSFQEEHQSINALIIKVDKVDNDVSALRQHVDDVITQTRRYGMIMDSNLTPIAVKK